MKTLDNVDHTFTSDMLLITDGGGPVGVAGVMGGLESEVADDTVDILLEAAHFDYISIRRTSSALKIPSEAAYRFGRGVDPELTITALHRAAELMRELGGGVVAQGFADVNPGKKPTQVIDLPISEVKRLLGIELDAASVAKMLGALGFAAKSSLASRPSCAPPCPVSGWIISIPADLIEEIARMYGWIGCPPRSCPTNCPRSSAISAWNWKSVCATSWWAAG
jgi:phenylalanyl-tRNA synthetase beta chain